MKKYKWSILYTAVFVVPVVAYLMVNFYWWLFDGNVLTADKMMASLFYLSIMWIPTAVLVGLERKAR